MKYQKLVTNRHVIGDLAKILKGCGSVVGAVWRKENQGTEHASKTSWKRTPFQCTESCVCNHCIGCIGESNEFVSDLSLPNCVNSLITLQRVKRTTLASKDYED